MTELVATALFPFCGLGAGARGFLDAHVSMLGRAARFESIGGIDSDADGCRDFERLTGSPSLCIDIAKLTPEQLRAFAGDRAPDVVFMSPPCLPGHEEIITARGLVPISSVRAGDQVLTHAGRYRPVRAVGAHMHDGEMVRMRLHGSVTTHEFTPKHPIWIRRDYKPVNAEGKQLKRRGAARFAAAGELRVGDRVGFPAEPEVLGTARAFVESFGDPTLTTRGGKNVGPHTKPEHVADLSYRVRDLRSFAESPSLWFLAGVYLGDGYRRPSRHEAIFCVGASDGELARRVRLALADLGLQAREDRDGGATNVKLRLHSKSLCAILGGFGDGAATKTIPAPLFGLEGPLVDALIDGCRASDGSESPTHWVRGKLFSATWKIVSISLPLLRGLQRLLLRRGVFGAIHVAAKAGTQTIEGRTVQTRDRWEIKVTPDRTRRGVHDLDDGVLWLRIRELSRRPCNERVWNLEVDDDDTFCLPLIATHNCKGASGLLSAKTAASPRYRAMNELALVWTRTMLATWTERPGLVLLENVPRLTTRAAPMLRDLRRLLRAAGYVLSDGYHDCGELGGLAQHRRRYLLVARHPGRVAPVLYQPPKKRVRACGEVLEQLPMPGTPEAARFGRLHELPRISWLNWVRLALIPAGGDWRDLEGVLDEGQAKREQWGRHHVEAWNEATGAVAGSGSNGVQNVADPRAREWFGGVVGVKSWDKYAVAGWDEPSGSVIGATRPGSGAPSVADPRVRPSEEWNRPMGYAVLSWEQAARTIAGKTSPGCGAYAVADVRVASTPHPGAYGVLGWDDAARTITGESRPSNGRFAVADPRKPPDIVPVTIAADGTWHRPLTTLELAALQGIPVELDGEPLTLAGSAVSRWRERIGNAVPPPAARAIAERMLVALVESAAGAWSLSSGGAVWVEREREARADG